MADQTRTRDILLSIPLFPLVVPVLTAVQPAMAPTGLNAKSAPVNLLIVHDVIFWQFPIRFRPAVEE
jgi:ABC-type transport system involved in cytochrome c biogenesis permease component